MNREVTSSRPSASPAARQQGQTRLGGYRLVRVLGRGGLAEVYEAFAEDGRRVALKTLRLPEDERSLAAEAFRREAHLGQRLQHPGIVRVLDGGVDGEHAFLALEYVDGHDLRRHTLKSALLPLPRVLAIAEQLAQALAAVHTLGVVHRDLKPANVLLLADGGTVKLADFGLARLGEAFLSRTGVLAGTPAYMAPEQLAEGALGPACDLYALGVLMFELLTGRLPFEAASLGELLQQLGRTAPPSLTTLRPELEPALAKPLAELVAELLAPRAEQRPPGASAVAQRLAALLGR